MKKILALSLLSTLGLAACGGAGYVKPKPLSFTFEKRYIALVPLPEKQSALSTVENDYEIADYQLWQAIANVDEADVKIKKSKNEREAAQLTFDSAKAEYDQASKTADMTRRTYAEKELNIADLKKKTADAKLEYFKEEKKFLVYYMRFAENDYYAKEAKVHLERAKLASSKNIRPDGFELGNYQDQFTDRSQKAQKYKVEAEDKKKRLDEKRQEWTIREKEYMAAAGLKGDMESQKVVVGGSLGAQPGMSTVDVPIENTQKTPTEVKKDETKKPEEIKPPPEEKKDDTGGTTTTPPTTTPPSGT